MDKNNDVLTDFKPFFSLKSLPHTSVGLTGCISNASSVWNICCVPLIVTSPLPGTTDYFLNPPFFEHHNKDGRYRAPEKKNSDFFLHTQNL